MPSLRHLPRKKSPHSSRSIPARKAARPAMRKGDTDPLVALEIGTVEEISRTLAAKHSFLLNFILTQPDEFYVDDRVGLSRSKVARMEELSGVLARLKQKAGRGQTFYAALEQEMRRGGRTFRAGDVFDPANPKGTKTLAARPASLAKDARAKVRKAAKVVPPDVAERLEYLRGEIEAERISWGEIAELQSLTEYIDDDDVLLLEWAGVEEGSRGKAARPAMRKAGKRKIVSNFTATDIPGVGTIYYSYDMPVSADIKGVGQIRRAKKFSATTTQHLNRFAKVPPYKEVDEAEWARIVGPHAKDADFQPRGYGRKSAAPIMRKSLSELKRLAIVEPDPRLRANYAEDLAKRMRINKAKGEGGDHPGDLVALDSLFMFEGGLLDEATINQVNAADWYQPNDGSNVILVSAAAIDYLSETDPADVGVDMSQGVTLIDRPLHRYSEEDGFYHA